MYRSIIVEDDDDELTEEKQIDFKEYPNTCPFYNEPTEHVQLENNFLGYRERVRQYAALKLQEKWQLLLICSIEH